MCTKKAIIKIEIEDSMFLALAGLMYQHSNDLLGEYDKSDCEEDKERLINNAQKWTDLAEQFSEQHDINFNED